MHTEASTIFEIVILFLVQLIIAAGMTSFSTLSRMHGDRIFPAEMRGSSPSRQLHRGRLHLVIMLIGLEIALIALVTYLLPHMTDRILPGRDPGSVLSPLILVAAFILVMLASAVAGVGFATRNPEKVAYAVSFPLWPVYILLRPLTALFLKAVSIVFPGLPRELALPFLLISGPEEKGEGFIEENGRMLMHSIVEFGEKKVREVMVPRIDIFALDKHMEIGEVRSSVNEAGHSRVPVHDGSIDRISGILYVKDLLRLQGDEGTGLDPLIREAYFVPESKKIEDLLREFQVEKIHMAIVVDEYGGTAGIVTLEDILEEIVGEIRDEYDHESPLVRETGDYSYAVEGRINLDDLCELLNISLPSEGVDTLGGFLYNLGGKVPAEGEEIEFGGMIFRINRLEGQRIAEVGLTLPGGRQDSRSG